MRTRRAIVVGSGPNGLAAAVTLARAGVRVTVYEAQPTIGGGVRTMELTRPGFWHDVCSAIHPLALASPFFAGLDLARRGVEWVQPEVPLAHPLDDGEAATLLRSVDETAAGLPPDEDAYRRLLAPLVLRSERLFDDLLRPPLHVPRHPATLLRFALRAGASARTIADRAFRGEAARALLAGLAAHAVRPLDDLPTGAFGLMLAVLGHAVGWPFPRGGADRIARALVAIVGEHGGEVVLNAPVRAVTDLPPADAVLLDLSPRGVVRVAGDLLPRRYRDRLLAFRHGPAAYKVDWALGEPIPWRAPACRRAGTVHVGGTFEEIARAESEVARGRHPERPFVLVAQHTVFDPSRAPAGRHTGWAYCHVPAGSTFDMTARLEAQVERFAPGFRDTILERSVLGPAALERHDANHVGGDVTGGAASLRQVLARPVASPDPYRTPRRGLYLCSSSTPPGAGVHGMCGYLAARSALRRLGR